MLSFTACTVEEIANRKNSIYIYIQINIILHIHLYIFSVHITVANVEQLNMQIEADRFKLIARV